MRPVYLIPIAFAALVAGTSLAAAQGFRDDPPGWAFQKRGIIEMNGGDPLRYGRYRHARGAYAWSGRHHRRHWRYRRHHRWW